MTKFSRPFARPSFQRSPEIGLEGERMDRVIAARAESLGLTFDAMRDEYLRKISLRRMVTVDDIAAMALFLASRAGRNISGQAISIDGNVEYI
jgi:NAD(P)-dependent dehydrogenase (short-subunit alcohol dehydrogenase family)